MDYNVPNYGKDVRVTFNPTTLLGSAISNQKAIFTAYYNAIVAWQGQSSPPAASTFFPGGGGDLGAFIIATNLSATQNNSGYQAGFTKYQAALLTNILALITGLNNVLTFATLAPTATSVPFDRWTDWTKYANQPTPSANDLNTIKDVT